MHNGQPHGCVSKMFWVIVVVYGMARLGKMGAKLRALVVVLSYMQSKLWNMVTRERLVIDCEDEDSESDHTCLFAGNEFQLNLVEERQTVKMQAFSNV